MMSRSSRLSVLLPLVLSLAISCSHKAAKMEVTASAENVDTREIQGSPPPPGANQRPGGFLVAGELEKTETRFVTARLGGLVKRVLVSAGDTLNADDPVVTIASDTLEDEIDVRLAAIRELSTKLNAVRNLLNTDLNSEPPAPEEVVEEEVPVVPITGPVTEEMRDLSGVSMLGPVPADLPATTVRTLTRTVPQQTAPLPPQALRDLETVFITAIERYNIEIDILEKKLSDLEQKSPVAGVVLEVLVSEGDSVSENTKLVAVGKTNPMSVVFHVPQDEASFIDRRTAVAVSSLQADIASTRGTVYFISPDVDPDNKTIEVRAYVTNEEGRLKGGQKVMVEVGRD